MVQLARDPYVVKLARDLGLSNRGDCLAHVRDFAFQRVDQTIEEAPIEVENLPVLQQLIAQAYRVKLEYIREDADIDRIVEKFPDFHPHLGRRLHVEFVEGSTEGITLERDEWDPIRFRFLAVVDARGERSSRAYFTGWHEITHLVLHPEQLPFPNFRRSPVRAEIRKDPLESVVDYVAGRLAFHARFFGPVLRREIAADQRLTFRSIDAAAAVATPGASLLAAAMGSLEHVSYPVQLATVEVRLKKSEERMLSLPQGVLPLAVPGPAPQLRVSALVSNRHVSASGLAIHPNIRVPARSVLAEAFDSDVTLSALEDQGWWETSARGALGKLPIHVEAIRRGRFVYGLISTGNTQ
jgi:hypothetical protein